MDDQNNEQDSQVKQIAEQEGKKIAKQGAKNLGRGIASKIPPQVKAAILTAIMAILKIVIIIAIAMAVFQIFLAAADWLLDVFTVEEAVEETNNLLGDYCIIDDSGIHFDKETLLKKLEESLNEDQIDFHSLGLDLMGYSEQEAKGKATEYLYEFMTASLASELPYIVGSDPEAQGIVKIKRLVRQEDGPIDLTYMGYERFKTLKDSKSKYEKEAAKYYFSIDELWNLCIYKSYSEKVNDSETYTIIEVKIPYRTMVSQYTIPFEFLMQLQATTQNAEYVKAVANLISKESEIEFTILDSVTTTTIDYTYRHSLMRKWKYEIEGTPNNSYLTGNHNEKQIIQGRSGPTKQPDEKTVTVIQESLIKANVTKANTWVIRQITNYEDQAELTETEHTNKIDGEDEPEGDNATWKVEQSETTKITEDKHEWMKSGDADIKLEPNVFLGLWRNSVGYYMPYKNADGTTHPEVLYNPTNSGKLVKYPLVGEGTEDRPVMNILTSEQQFLENLQDNMRTQMHAEIMKYLIELYRNEGRLDGIEDISALLSIYEPPEFVEGSYAGDFDVHDESMFITNVEVLRQALRDGYSASEQLVAHAQDFLDMQKEYKVNALFAAAVSITETSAGRKGNAINECHNWFNITTSTPPYKTTTNKKTGETYHWKIYNNASEGIGAFGNLIKNGSYYYTQGNYTVRTIGAHYCPNTSVHPHQADTWSENTMAQISRFYAAVGIDANAFLIGGGAGAGGMTGAAGEGDRGTYTTADGKSFIEYLQYAGPWMYNPYGGGTMKNSGCSVASVATILSGYGVDKNPEDIRRTGNGNFINVTGTLNAYGLHCQIVSSPSTTQVLNHLKSGGSVIVHAGGPKTGYGTTWSETTGHYFPVLEANGNEAYVSNVGSSTKTGWYDINTILKDNKKVILISK